MTTQALFSGISSLKLKHIRASFDADQNVYWAHMHSSPVQQLKPCCSSEIIDDGIAYQKFLGRSAFSRRSSQADVPARTYFVLASDAAVYNLGGDLALFIEAIRLKNKEALLKYALKCVEAVHGFQDIADGQVHSIALVQGDALGGGLEVALSCNTLIAERGAQDMQSEMERFPRLFRGADSVPGLTWPTLVIGGGNPTRIVTDAQGRSQGEPPGKLTLDLGGVQVQIWSPGPGHTRGDTIAWVEAEGVLFSGDLVEYEAGVYTGDAQLQEWPATLAALRALDAQYLVPGRGAAMRGRAQVAQALDYTERWVTLLYQAAREAVAAGMDLKAAMAHTRQRMDPVFGHVFIYEHCLPFDVSRAFDEASGIKHPRIWTAARDQEMWRALQA